MARDRSHPPSAACLSESMRDLGYSLETAIADLIDNSISAGADTIDIICDVSGEHPVMVILDNGRGMTEDELLDAMRHGTGNPRQHRSPKDLGRFGLGLKTASFSQCRSLTVVSTRDGTVCGAEWNLIASMLPTTGFFPSWTMRTSMGCLMSNGSAPGARPLSGESSTD